MSEIDESDLSVAEVLPTGTVTLLLADVEGSTRLWQTVPVEMAAAIARLDDVLSQIVPGHRGVRPVEQGEGDSFVLAFSRAADAVACALDLQRAPLAPIRVRIGVHTGDVQLRDEGNYIGTTINKAARLRDLAHGGQTVLSGAAAELVADRTAGHICKRLMPSSVWPPPSAIKVAMATPRGCWQRPQRSGIVLGWCASRFTRPAIAACSPNFETS